MNELKNKTMWAFIDYENIPSLEEIDLSAYTKVIIFLGAQQSSLNFGKSKYRAPVQLEVITLHNSHANNLDFHLSYYLGKYDALCSPEITFHVISKDKGFTHLLHHINANGRKCNQITETKPNTAPVTTKRSLIRNQLKNKQLKNKPRKLESLKNFIASQMKLQGNDIAVQSEVNYLINQKVLEIESNKVNYL